MSIPPNTPPPGYYGAQPPPSKSGAGKVLAGLGIGCGVVFLLILIGGILLVRSVKNQIAHPSKNSVLGTAITAGKAGIDGALIRQTIVSYHQQHGHYPKSLMDMVADGSLDGKLLHNDLDDNPSPGHVSWRYTQPAEGAPGDTPVLEETYHVSLGSKDQPGRLVITLDGKSVSNVSPQNSQ